MIEQPSWNVISDTKLTSFPNSREILLKSDDKTFSETLLRITENNIYMILPVLEPEISEERSYFKKKWNTVLKIKTKENLNLKNASLENIMTFFYEACQNPTRKQNAKSNLSPEYTFNKKYSFNDLEILVVLFLKKYFSCHSFIVDYSKLKIRLNLIMPFLGSKASVEYFRLETEDFIFRLKDEKKIQEEIEHFFQWLKPENFNLWKIQNSIFVLEETSWSLDDIEESVLEKITAHEKIKFKKIVEDFFKTQGPLE